MSNKTVREAAQAVVDSYHKGELVYFGDLREALAQPDPETTLCGMDEGRMKELVRWLKKARRFLEIDDPLAAQQSLVVALSNLPVERKTWTVPSRRSDRVDVSVGARLDWPKGVRAIFDSNGWDWMFYEATICPDQEIDITDPNNPFIVGEQS